MLTADEKREIEKELAHYPYKRAACVDALKIVQRRRRWVSDEDMVEIAGLLDMSPEELDGVATFYNLIFRRPVGRHVILLCDSVSCWIMGCDKVFKKVSGRLGAGYGGTSADDRFTLLPIACLGHCEGAPALMVDDDVHVKVTDENVDAILDRYE